LPGALPIGTTPRKDILVHELSIMQSILDIVTETATKHKLSKINKIQVVLGALSGVEPAALYFAFAYYVRDTLADGAELAITTMGVTGRCRRCGVTMDGIYQLRCNCDRLPDYEMLTGKELYVDTITGD
jgi:hydrogenase nickel incorporation protein HypA/HybF